jgi:DNA repair exonuclease SbcCD ATPase subunit
MQVALLQIENFRGIRNGKVQFRDHTVLIGPNNSGKTTIVEALALVLGRDRLVRSLTEHDFHSSDPEPASRIKIIATVIGSSPRILRRTPIGSGKDAAFRCGSIRLRGAYCQRGRMSGSALPARSSLQLISISKV